MNVTRDSLRLRNPIGRTDKIEKEEFFFFFSIFHRFFSFLNCTNVRLQADANNKTGKKMTAVTLRRRKKHILKFLVLRNCLSFASYFIFRVGKPRPPRPFRELCQGFLNFIFFFLASTELRDRRNRGSNRSLELIGCIVISFSSACLRCVVRRQNRFTAIDSCVGGRHPISPRLAFSSNAAGSQKGGVICRHNALLLYYSNGYQASMPNHLALAYRISRLDDSLNKKLYGVVFPQLPSSSRPNGLMSTIKKEEERKKVERRVLNGRNCREQ